MAKKTQWIILIFSNILYTLVDNISYLKSQICIFMHTKDLSIVYDWKTFNILLVFLQVVCPWGVVDPCTWKTVDRVFMERR